jgi:hypothetical protein
VTRAWLALLLAATLPGCVVYQARGLPEIPVRDPKGARLFVLVERHPPSLHDWDAAAEMAKKLEHAGFRPAVVASLEDVPADQPVVVSYGGFRDDGEPASCDRVVGPLRVGMFLTLGIIPGFFCGASGEVLKLRRTPTSAPVTVDTRWWSQTGVGWFVSAFTLSDEWTIVDDLEREPRALAVGVLAALGDPP